MRTPDFSYICESKGTDQLHHNRAADQCLCFRYIEQSLYFINPIFQAPSHLLRLYSPITDLVRNTEDRFSHDAAHIKLRRTINMIHVGNMIA